MQISRALKAKYSKPITHSLHDNFLAFPEALLILNFNRPFKASENEFCMWIFEGKENGGLQAYVKDVNTNKLIRLL